MRQVIDYSHAITRALNAGDLKSAQFIIDTETEDMFMEGKVEFDFEKDKNPGCNFVITKKGKENG